MFESFDKAPASTSEGNTQSQYMMASDYLQGNGVPFDFEKGINLLARAARQGHALAQGDIAILTLESDADDEAKSLAVDYLKKSAAQGYARAQCRLAHLYLKGDCVERDIDEGLKLLAISVDQEYPQAVHMFGRLYVEGEILPRNLDKGFELIKQAALQGCAEAQHDLGDLYEIIGDSKNGRLWIERAANNDHPLAQFKMSGYILKNPSEENAGRKLAGWIGLTCINFNKMAKGLGVSAEERNAMMDAIRKPRDPASAKLLRDCANDRTIPEFYFA